MLGGARTRVRTLLGRPAAVRTAWGTADQLLSSLSNFALGLLVVRTVDVGAFGVYSLLVAAYMMSVGSVRSVYVQPFTIRREEADPVGDRRDQEAVLGGALAAGALGVVVMLVLAPLVGASYVTGLLAFAVTFPGLLVQDAYRLVFFARLQPRQAAFNDLVWTVVQFGLAAVVLAMDRASVATLVLCWGGGATVAAVYGYLQCRTAPRPGLAVGYVRRHRDLSMPFLGEFWASYGVAEITVYGMGAVASLAAVGAFKAAALFMGPLNLLNNAVVNVALPELSRIRRHSVRRVRRLAAGVGGLLCLAALALGGILIVIPDDLGRFIAGPTWATLIPVVLPLALARAASGVVTGALLGTRVLEAADRTLKTRLATSPLIYGATLAGARYWGAAGAAAGMALGLWLSAIVWWNQYRLAEQQFGSLERSNA